MKSKKITAIIISLLLAFSFCMPVLATEDTVVEEDTAVYEEDTVVEEDTAYDEETYAEDTTEAEETTTVNDDETVEQKETTTSKDSETTASDSETTAADSETTAAKANSTSDTVATTNDSGAVEIYCYDDLLKIASNPSGNYELMVDIDLAGEEWEPVNFSGTLEGNGHAILNASITSFAEGTQTVYDGNYLEYEAVFSGFFGSLENANISNLKILGTNIDVTSNQDCFVGLLAGYMKNSKIDSCEIEGIAKVEAKAYCFGIGGFVGFGSGSIKNSKNEVTLVSVDNDTETKDEEFMGGAYASGYIDLDSNEVNIKGYNSEHGYVHSGGLVGMYALSPDDDTYKGYITNNYVSGKITFFEDNTDRRAYCEPYCGEIMNWTFDYDGNSDDFTADERTDYSQTLLPEMCENAEYTDTTTESSCTEYGYTEHKCKTCDYSYKSDYQPLAHNVTSWEVTKEATMDSEGVEQGKCTKCGTIVYNQIPVLTAEEAETAEQAASQGKGLGAGWIILIVVVVIAIVLFVLYNINKRKQEELRRRKAAKMHTAGGRPGPNGQRPGNPQRRPGPNGQRQGAPQRRPAQGGQRPGAPQRRPAQNTGRPEQPQRRPVQNGGSQNKGMRSRLNDQDPR